MNSPFDLNIPIHHRCTAILIDDDEHFLISLRKALGKDSAVLAYSSPSKALQAIHQAQGITQNAFNLFMPYHSASEKVDAGDDIVLLKTSRIRAFAESVDTQIQHPSA
jgi:hypothetical protein